MKFPNKMLSLLFPALLLTALPILAQSSLSVAGTYEGNATVHDQQVPVRLSITGSGTDLHAALLNGPEQSAASAVALTGNHLVVTFNYFARTLDATMADGQLTGSFGIAKTRYPVTLHAQRAATQPATKGPAPDVSGTWEIAVKSAKGESAWTLETATDPSTHSARAVIQRIDGDTGSLYGQWTGSEYRLSHFTAAGAALYTLTPQPDGTLLVSNLLAADAQKAQQQNLVARRPAEARKLNLPPPTASTEQTSIKDPSRPFTFSFPDLSDKVVSNSDPRFNGKVVIVAIGGSWCPNCHDEAPFLESLYKQFHNQGLEIVDLSFEEADQLKDPVRLRAFIARYGITYTVLVAGDPDQLNEKITQANNLNSWPTAFFLGRDGRVREIHAGFAGPGNPKAHEALTQEVTALVKNLLAEPLPKHAAQAVAHN